MADVIDLEERRRRAKILNLASGGSYVVAVGQDDVLGVGVVVPPGHDGITLTPEEARGMAADLIECAGAIEGRKWLFSEKE